MESDPVHTLALTATDEDSVEQMIDGIPLAVHRLAATPGDVHVAATQLADIQVFVGEFGFPVSTEGEVDDESTLLALTVDHGGGGSWNGHDFADDKVWVYGPGSEHLGVGQGPRPPRFATISLPARRLRNHPAHGRHHVIQGPAIADLRRTIVEVASGPLTAAAAANANRSIVASLTDLADYDEIPVVDETSATWITKNCLDVAADLGPMPSSADLGAAIGMSDRWVRAAFRRVYDLSPSEFFRFRALRAVRRDLREASPAQTSVTEVAMKWGFWHLGRFSASYRSFFGELPSTTLAA